MRLLLVLPSALSLMLMLLPLFLKRLLILISPFQLFELPEDILWELPVYGISDSCMVENSPMFLTRWLIWKCLDGILR